MNVVDWLLSIRRKPLQERRKFVAVFTIVATAGITLIWLFLFITVGPLQVKPEDKKSQFALPPVFSEMFNN